MAITRYISHPVAAQTLNRKGSLHLGAWATFFPHAKHEHSRQLFDLAGAHMHALVVLAPHSISVAPRSRDGTDFKLKNGVPSPGDPPPFHSIGFLTAQKNTCATAADSKSCLHCRAYYLILTAASVVH